MSKIWRPVLPDLTAIDSYLWVLCSDAEQKFIVVRGIPVFSFSELTGESRKKSPPKISPKDVTEGCLRLFHIIMHDDEN